MLPNTSLPEDPALNATSVSENAHSRALSNLREPSFLHPSSILFDIASHVRRYLIPAAVAIYSAASGGTFGIGIAILVFGSALVTTLLRYFTLRYRIFENDFVVTEGLFFRRVRSVPIRRIQNVDLVQNVLHRIFGVAEVRIETASGTEPEAILRVLTRGQIAELRQAIFGGAAATTPSETDATHEAIPALANSAASGLPASSLLHRISTKQLVLAGVASNRGMVLLGVAAGLYFQNAYSWDPTSRVKGEVRDWFRFDSEQLTAYLPQLNAPGGYAVAVILGILLVLLCLRLFGIAWYILRFYDHQLTRKANELQISCGLFTKVSATIPRKRIQFISIHRSLLMRWMKLAAIRIETAGGGGKEGEDAAATVSRRWFLPVVGEPEVSRLLGELRPGIQWDESQVTWHAVSPWTGRRLMRFAVVFSLVLSLAGFAASRPWGLALGLVSFAVLALLAYKKCRSMRYARMPWGVAYRSGLLTRKLSFAFYDRIQTVSFNQSPFDRRWKMASLTIDTAAAGPANHVIDIGYLDAEFAHRQFEELQFATTRHSPS